MITPVMQTVAKKNTKLRPKIKLVSIIWTKMRPTSTTKYFQKIKIRGLIK